MRDGAWDACAASVGAATAVRGRLASAPFPSVHDALIAAESNDGVWKAGEPPPGDSWIALKDIKCTGGSMVSEAQPLGLWHVRLYINISISLSHEECDA